jgi:hypothetical protein
MAEKASQKDWPPGVEPISWVNAKRLGVGQDGQLYWDGQPVVTRRRLDLSFWERVLGVVVAAAVIVAASAPLSQPSMPGSLSAARSTG